MAEKRKEEVNRHILRLPAANVAHGTSHLVLKRLICMDYSVQVKHIWSAPHKRILCRLAPITFRARTGILNNKQQNCCLLETKAISQLFVGIY